ncbi:hypothetical protein OG948_39990 (plasmid) [Embleya sp. NBC_00888]|uniref:hypothetical protein n=1 Tax=Embleya sp. NBC_00888 TaxID=2975960 RepID=UPI002F9198C2|nr:hypothetical protein OG948_39990 [Embleya sp. NBC_00888]
MVSESFMLATRIPMARRDFETWLDIPVPGTEVLANPGEMFTGWFWDGTGSDDRWARVEEDTTAREFFAECVEQACAGEPTTVVLLYREGALEAYLFEIGYDERSMHTALLLLAGAGRFGSEPGREHVLFWAETSGALLKPSDDGWLAVLSVGRDGARFTGRADLAETVAGLRPTEDRFYALIERMAEDEERWDSESGDSFHSDAPRDPLFIDPEVLR